MRNMTMEKTSIIQLPSPTLHKTEEKKVSSSPKKMITKLSTMKMFICQIRSITRVTKIVVIIITPSSAMPAIKRNQNEAYVVLSQKTAYAREPEQSNCVFAVSITIKWIQVKCIFQIIYSFSLSKRQTQMRFK